MTSCEPGEALRRSAGALCGAAAVVVAVVGAASLAWALLAVVGLGLYLLVPSLVLCAAAVLLVVRAVESARGRASRSTGRRPRRRRPLSGP